MQWYKRHKRSQNFDMEREFYQKIKFLPDNEFDEFLRSIKSKINKKFGLDKKRINYTQMKIALRNVINKHTLEDDLPKKRVKQIEQVFPLVKRVYFGPKLTEEIFSDKTHKRKYRFNLKPNSTIPKLNSIIDVAYFFKTTVNKILGLCYTRYHSSLNSRRNLEDYESPFYQHYFHTKPNGRRRLIAIPVPFLKWYQKIILKEILEKAILPDYCTGFVPTLSIVSNARIHLGAQTLVKIDLQNFFNTLKFRQVFEVFRGFGYNRQVSGILACICTDFYYRGGRYVPQGSPASPMIANLYASHLDKRIIGLWNKHGFHYSRYADDLSFSTIKPRVKVRNLIQATYKIIRDEKLYPNIEKTKVFRKGQRKSVTGITVNEELNVDRKWLNQLRGEVYRIEKFGLPSENDMEKSRILRQLKGKIAYLYMVNPVKADTFMDKFNLIIEKHAY